MMNVYNSNNSNWVSPCSNHYLIDENLHNALVTGHLPQSSQNKKSVSLDKFGFYLVAFRILGNNNPTLIYNYVFYPDIFTDVFLMYSITRFRFIDSWIYNEWGGIFTFIDESLGYDKKGIIKDLMHTPDKFNEYLYLEYRNPESEINNLNINSNVINFLNKRVYIMNLYKMFNILNSIYLRDDRNFMHHLYSRPLDKIPSNFMLETSILNNSVFIVRDLNKFLNIIKRETSFNLNQGNQKWRGQINSLNSFINCFDQDFRHDLFLYNQYHIDRDNISYALNLPKDLFSFNNIHKKLGNSLI